LLTLARKLAETPGLIWVEANNAAYGPGGPFVRVFLTKADRAAFARAEEHRQVDELIDSLPDPPVGPQHRIPKSLHAALASEADAKGVSLNQLVPAKLAFHLQPQ
jgi:hypothetical protein